MEWKGEKLGADSQSAPSFLETRDLKPRGNGSQFQDEHIILDM